MCFGAVARQCWALLRLDGSAETLDQQPGMRMPLGMTDLVTVTRRPT